MCLSIAKVQIRSSPHRGGSGRGFTRLPTGGLSLQVDTAVSEYAVHNLAERRRDFMEQ